MSENIQFFNKQQVAEATIRPELYDYLEDSGNIALYNVLVQEEFSELHLKLEIFEEEPSNNNLYQELLSITNSAKAANLDIVILSRGE